MRLTAKLMYMLIGVLFLGVAVQGYIRVQREIKFFDFDMERDARVLGNGMRSAVAAVWMTAGHERALQLIDDSNQAGQIVRCRWVWLDPGAEEPSRPHVSSADLEPLTRGETISIKKEQGEYGGYRYTYVPVQVQAARPGALEIAEPLSQIDEYTRTTILRMFVTTAAMTVLIGCVMAMFGMWLVGRPLHLLTEKAKRVGLGDLSGPLHLPGRDELSELAASMNSMCTSLLEAQQKIASETAARIEALEQLRHADRLKTVGRLASGIAHELGTPLNVVSGRAGLIEAGALSAAETLDSARIIRAQADRMTTLIRNLLNFARRQPSAKALVDVRLVVSRTLELLSAMGRKRNVAMTFVGDEVPMMVKADAGQIDQALTNLVMNAMQAMPTGGKIEVSLCREHAHPPEGSEAKEGDYLCLAVQDEGEGIAPENLLHIFEPFFTTRGVGQGTGLGLSIAYGIIRDHGGWIGVSSQVSRGSRFSIYLPQGTD